MYVSMHLPVCCLRCCACMYLCIFLCAVCVASLLCTYALPRLWPFSCRRLDFAQHAVPRVGGHAGGRVGGLRRNSLHERQRCSVLCVCAVCLCCVFVQCLCAVFVCVQCLYAVCSCLRAVFVFTHCVLSLALSDAHTYITLDCSDCAHTSPSIGATVMDV